MLETLLIWEVASQGVFLEKEDCMDVLKEHGEELMGDKANLEQENKIFLGWGSQEAFLG